MNGESNRFLNCTPSERQAIAAYWLCERKGIDGSGAYFRQSDLPKIFGEVLTRSDLSRLARNAQEEGYYKETTIRVCTLPQHLHDWVRSQFAVFPNLEGNLCKRYKNLNRVIVSPAAYDDPLIDDEAWDKSLTIFGQSAAKDLLTILLDSIRAIGRKRVLNLGIGWGRTLASIVGAIAETSPAQLVHNEFSEHFSAFPMWGALYRPKSVPTSTYDSQSPQTAGASSSALAVVLQKAMTGGGDATPSIHGLPAILPSKWNDYGEAKFRARRIQFLTDLSDFTSYEEIFGLPRNKAETDQTPSTLIERMDGALVTVGASSHPTRFYHGDSFSHYFGTGSEEEVQFRKHCIGDIGGVLLANGSPGSSAKADKFIKSICKYFTCTQREHLEKLSDKAGKYPDLPGVIAVVHGSARIDAVERALSEGLINTLITCPHLGKALNERLQAR